MKKTLSRKLPQTPLLAVDCVVQDTQGALLLMRRKNSPFKGVLALPGGFVEEGENVEDACRRELLEETGLHIKNLRLVGVYSNPERDPRGHICSIAFAGHTQKRKPKAGDDASQVVWTHSWRKVKLAFDHRKIISDALNIP